GYALRPRYCPNWMPTWRFPGNEGIWRGRLEDFLYIMPGEVLDAVRVADGVKVILERIDTTRLDLGVIIFLSERARREFFHPGNRTVHLLDIVPLADNEEVLISMPMLRIFDDPPFGQVSEALDAFHEFLKVLI
ncbi:hypothetical protein B0H14DRAFT_2334892, partial [Mycena olivaceomarginata]